MIKFVAALAMALGLAAPAYAASFTVTPGSGPILTSSITGNAFNGSAGSLNSDLISVFGLTMATDGQVSLSGHGTVNFFAYGSEGSFIETFHAGTGPGSLTYTEPFGGTAAHLLGMTLIGSRVYGGAITDLFFTDNQAGTGTIGSPTTGGRFMVFYSPTDTSVVGLAYDDMNKGEPDDNHDDLIIIARIVPEPATWSLMIAGFALLGWMQRRRVAAVRA